MNNDAINRLNTALEGRYRIEREVGEGGMATVYLAHDVRHERRVALKVLKPDLAAVVGADRFLAEIKTTAGLQHPHISAAARLGGRGRLPLLRHALRGGRDAARATGSRAPAPRRRGRADRGRELFYRGGGGMLIAAQIADGDPPRVIARTPLFYADRYRMLYFRGGRPGARLRPFDIAPDGRFLILTTSGERAPDAGGPSVAKVVVLIDALARIQEWDPGR